MYIIHPKTSFTQVQFPLPTISFLTLIESLDLPGKDVKIHFSARTMPPKTSSCRSDPPMNRCYHIVHVTIDVCGAIQGAGWYRAGLRYF